MPSQNKGSDLVLFSENTVFLHDLICPFFSHFPLSSKKKEDIFPHIGIFLRLFLANVLDNDLFPVVVSAFF